MYEVINETTGESHGCFASLDEARGCVRFDHLDAGPGYSIWRDSMVRVEACEPVHEDARVRQGLGQGDY